MQYINSIMKHCSNGMGLRLIVCNWLIKMNPCWICSCTISWNWLWWWVHESIVATVAMTENKLDFIIVGSKQSLHYIYYPKIAWKFRIKMTVSNTDFSMRKHVNQKKYRSRWINDVNFANSVPETIKKRTGFNVLLFDK